MGLRRGFVHSTTILPSSISVAAHRVAILIAVITVAVASSGLAGCGGSSTAAVDAFGPPPSATPGVRAWAIGEVGTVLFTDDGGASWQRRPFNLPTRALDIAFTDARSGWLVTDSGTVLASTDGGTKWEVRKQTDLRLHAVASTDAGHVWALGEVQDSLTGLTRGVVLRSDDGGATWSRQGFGDVPLVDVVFADARHGWLVGSFVIWSTTDGGVTWKVRQRRDRVVFTGATASDRDNVWVVGWTTQNGSPLVLASRNGGSSWSRQPVDVPKPKTGDLQLEQATCAGPQELWLTCKAGVIATADGGATWSLQEVPGGAACFAIAAADADHVLATTHGQPILVTADAGATWRAFGEPGHLKQELVGIAAVRAPAAE